MRDDLRPYRDELVISSKAGWDMWPGPYGNFGSRKYLIASLDQSLKRMGLEYVDIFYHHRPDPETPLEETMGALASLVHSGKALYAGISQYQPEETRKAAALLKQMGVPCLIHQPVYNMFDRWVEDGLLDALDDEGIGCIVFSPLAQGLLTNRYLEGIPEGSRATKVLSYLPPERIKADKIAKVRKLNEIAKARGQSMAEMALVWVLRRKTVTSALIGASSPQQLEDNVAALKNMVFSDGEMQSIERILQG
jgi:L-glyceraldehyde 3-phosphate reductase